MNIQHVFRFVLLLLFFASHAYGQQPNTLMHSIPPPFGTKQTGAQLGYSVSVDGGYTVLGAPLDDTGAADSGVVKVFDSNTGALLHVIPNPTPSPNDQFGYSVAISGSRVVVGAFQDDSGASDAGSAYLYDLASLTPTLPQNTINNPDPNVSDRFGSAVAISGTRAVVGAYSDDNGATNAGTAYVYDLSSGTSAVLSLTLNNPEPAANDRFAWSVGVSNALVVVGAYFDDTGATESGSAYVYDLNSGTPTVPTATLNNPSPAAFDNFGFAVAISGTKVVVGVVGDDTGASSAGSAYVYDLSSGTPATPLHTLNNPSPDTLDAFGASVAISGQVVVVGSYSDDTGANDTGIAYLYDLTSATPAVPTRTFTNPSADEQDKFGWSVGLSGTALIVGAISDDTNATNAGSGYLFDLGSGTPTLPIFALNDPGPIADDRFGWAVALSGNSVVVGAYTDDTGAVDAGSVYVYDLSGVDPTSPHIAINNPTPNATDWFGSSVAVSGNYVVVGAPQDDTGEVDAGSAYVYDLSSVTPTVPIATLNNPSPGNGDYFGYSVAISGTKIVVGAGFDDEGTSDAGSAYLYDLASATPTSPTITFNNPSPLTLLDRFGTSVAISGNRLVIGAYTDSTGATAAGSAYVYDLNIASPEIPLLSLHNPNPSASDQFGFAVAISETRVVVGARLDDEGATDAGSTYVYDLSSGTPTVPIFTLNNPSPATGDEFGFAVAISGGRVVVGAPRDSAVASNAGSAFIYDTDSETPFTVISVVNDRFPLAGEWFGNSIALEGTTLVVGSPNDDTVMNNKGYAFVFGPPDTTDAPTLTAPASSSSTTSPISVSFTLPEAALPGSVKLSFGATQLTLAASQETAGAHSFSFDPANPTASPEIASGSAIADGSYTVTLSYQDAPGNPAAQVQATDVVVDTETLTPTLTAPAASATTAIPIAVSFSLPEDASPESVKLSFGDTELKLATSQETAGSHSFTFDPLDPLASPEISVGDPLLNGTYTVTLSYQDALGNDGASVSATGVVIDRDPLLSTEASKGGAVPGAGAVGSGIPAGAVWHRLGVPALSELGQIAVLGEWKVGTSRGLGLFYQDSAGGQMTLLAAKGAAVPGVPNAVYSGFKDPLLCPCGAAVWYATLANAPGTTGAVRTSTDAAIFLDEDGPGGDPPVIVARKGAVAADTASAKWASFSSVVVSEGSVGFFGKMVVSASAGVSLASDSGLWLYDRFSESNVMLLREGEVVLGSRVKTISALTTRTKAGGQGRGVISSFGDEQISLRVTLNNGRTAIGVVLYPSSLDFPYESNTDAVGYGTGALWSSFSMPGQTNPTGALCFRGVVKPGTGTATATNNVALFAEDDATWTLTKRYGLKDPAGITGGVFSGFSDPVNESGEVLAFIGSMASNSAAGITSSSNDGVWYDDSTVLKLMAREGAQPPGVVTGARWKSFTTVALPEGRGPIFVATLEVGRAGITTGKDKGVWATDSTGAVKKLIQEGDPIGTSKVASFQVLSTVAGSPAQTRSFNNNGEVVMQVTDAAGGTHLLHVAVP